MSSRLRSSGGPPPSRAVGVSREEGRAPERTGASRRAPPSPPPPSAPSLRPPRNCTVSATTSSLLRLSPSLVSQEENSSRPSTKTGRPFVRYWLQISPSRPHAVMSTKQTVSFFSPLPLSVYSRLTARPNLATAVPEGL